MFKLLTIQDTVLVPAHLFGMPRLNALEHMVNKRFSDRVIPGHGLCIALWDFVRAGEDRLVVQTGESSTRCIFRIVVFCPFEGEVVFGTISASHKSGVFVQMGFFDAVHISKDKLPRPSDYDEKENVWIWRPDIAGGEGEEQPVEGAAQALYMDATNECVFRVERCDFENRRRIKPTERAAEGGTSAMSLAGALYDEVLEDNQGLGDPLWWYEGEEGEEGADGEGEEAIGDGENVDDGDEAELDRAGDGDGEYEDWQEGSGEDEFQGNGEIGADEDEYEENGEESCGMVDEEG